jgi:hypothetical protein
VRTAGLDNKNYQPVCAFNLEKLGLVEGSHRGNPAFEAVTLTPNLEVSSCPVLTGRVVNH